MNRHIERPKGYILDSLRNQGATKAEMADIVHAPTGKDAWDRVFKLGEAISMRRPV